MKIKGRLQSEIGASYNLVIEIFLPNPRVSERHPLPLPSQRLVGSCACPTQQWELAQQESFIFYGEILESETICKHKFNTLISFTLVRVKNE